MEEEILYDFFGEEYRAYAEKTPIMIPFIKGYKIPVITKRPQKPLKQ